ncbi:MAG: putative O-glycosylation ligase, exosortase A system-associated [Pseudomonadota bacterium]
MRDIIVMVAFLGLLPLCFSRPFVGILVWTWFAVMNPHREAFGFAYMFQFNMVIALATMCGLVFSKEKIRPVINWGIVILFCFFGWTIYTTSQALQPEYSYNFMMNIPMKIYIYILLLVLLVNREERVISMVWITVFSLGYYGANIGLVGILEFGKNLGRSGNFGPVDTMIQDRNHMSVALCMMLPLMHYLIKYTEKDWIRKLLWAVLGLSILTILVSYSRGGWICMMFIAGYYFWFVRNKAIYLVAGFIAAIPLAFLLQEEWYKRMSLKDIDKDESLNVRFEAWNLIKELADKYPFTGVGFRGNQNLKIFEDHAYATKLEVPMAAHSIYYEVLGDHGFPGLLLFLLSIFAGLFCNYKTRKLVQNMPDFFWCRDLSNALQLSILVFCLGGAALSLAYFDVFYIVLILSLILYSLTKAKINKTHVAAQQKIYKTQLVPNNP